MDRLLGIVWRYAGGRRRCGDTVTDNPYSAPSAPLRDAPSQADVVRIYSPTQVACGTIGGPVGLIYFLKANFASLGNERLEKQTLLYGGLLILALLALTPLLPDWFPNWPISIAYILMARYVAQNYQMTKQDIASSTVYDFHSNWRVLGLGLLCLLASVIVIVVPLVTLILLGIWNP